MARTTKAPAAKAETAAAPGTEQGAAPAAGGAELPAAAKPETAAPSTDTAAAPVAPVALGVDLAAGADTTVASLHVSGEANQALVEQLATYLAAGGDAAALSLLDLLGERLRQITEEGCSLERDDELQGFELPKAAACYAIAGTDAPRHRAAIYWPFTQPMKRDGGARRNQVKAGALLLAELERGYRAEAAE